MPNNKKVIRCPQPEKWTFYDWVDLNGSNPIEKWLADQSDEVRMFFNSTLKVARKTQDYRQWNTYRHKMKGRAGEEGIREIGFVAEGRQYRILFKFDGSMKSVLLCGCYHKAGRWYPQNAPDTAAVRARALERGKAKKYERQITDDF